MAKKKKDVYTVYTPLVPPQEIKGVAQDKNIPPYPDQQTAYAGYAKRLLSGDIYQLIKQDNYMSSIGIGTNLAGVAAGTYTISRNYSERAFIFNSVLVNYIQTGIINTIDILDGSGNNGIRLYLPTTTGNNFSFNQIPRPFVENTFQIIITNNIPVNEFVAITLFGWNENK